MDKKISDLTLGSLNSGDYVPTERSGVNYKLPLYDSIFAVFDTISNTITTFGELQTAIAAAATTPTRVTLYSDITITSSITIPRDLIITFRGQKFINGDNYYVTFNSRPEAGREQIFSGFEAGDINGNFGSSEIFPEWWGLVGTGYSDGEHEIAINCAIRTHGARQSYAITSAQNSGGLTQLNVASSTNVEQGMRIRIKATSSGDTEYDGWWTVYSKTTGIIVIDKAWSSNSFTGNYYSTVNGSTGNCISLAAGTYYVMSSIDLRDSASTLKGAGSGATYIYASTDWTPAEWFSSEFGVWDIMATDGIWDIGMLSDSTSHAWMVLIGSTNLGGGADFRAGVRGVTISGYYAVRKWPVKRISLLGGNGWCEENHVFNDLGLSTFSGFGIGWYGFGSISTLNGPKFENIWITNGTRRGSIPLYISNQAVNFSVDTITIDGRLAKASSMGWAIDDSALSGGTVGGAGSGCFRVVAATNVITTRNSTDTADAVHSKSVGQEVQFASSVTLPTGLTAGTLYYVLTVPSSTTMTVAASPGGPVIDITDTGSGTHKWTGYQEDWSLFGIYAAGAHTDLRNLHIEGVGKAVWWFQNDTPGSLTINNINGYLLMEEPMTYYNDPSRIPGPVQSPLDPLVDAENWDYSAIVTLGKQYGESSGAYNSTDHAVITNLRSQGNTKFLLVDGFCLLKVSSFGIGRYPNDDSSNIAFFARGTPRAVGTSTAISSAATNFAGARTALTVSSIAGFSDTDLVFIASSTVGGPATYDSADGFSIVGAPSGTTIIINKSWTATTTGRLYKLGATSNTNYTLIQ